MWPRTDNNYLFMWPSTDNNYYLTNITYWFIYFISTWIKLNPFMFPCMFCTTTHQFKQLKYLRAYWTFDHANPFMKNRMELFCQTFCKTAPAPPEKPLHQRSWSRSCFWRSRSSAKQALSPTSAQLITLIGELKLTHTLWWLLIEGSGVGHTHRLVAALKLNWLFF